MTPHMMAEWRKRGIYFGISMTPDGAHLEYPADRAWQQFLDVLTGRAGSCPTLEELAMTDEELLQSIQDIINRGERPEDALALIRELLEERGE